jgi:hypothetical protein
MMQLIIGGSATLVKKYVQGWITEPKNLSFTYSIVWM